MRWRIPVLAVLGSLLLAALWLPGPALADNPPLCRTPQVVIPDADENDTPGVVTDTLSLSGIGQVGHLAVSIDAAHSWVGDLVVALEHVDTGTRVTLIDRPGYPADPAGCGGDDLAVTLDDNASVPVESTCTPGSPAIGGTLSPNNPLSAFAGESLAGDWRLTVSDASALSSGTLNGWCLLPSPRVDLALTQAADKVTPGENEPVVLTLSLQNNGPDPASGIAVRDLLPAGLLFDGAAASQGSYDSAAGLWAVGGLPPAGSASLAITATVAAGQAGQTITNSAEVSALAEFDTDPANNAAAATLRVSGTDLVLTKLVNRPSASEGDLLVYTIRLRNAGGELASGVTVSDTLPAGLALVAAAASDGSYDGAAGTWQVGSLPADGRASLVISATVQPGTAGQTIVNTAEASAAAPADVNPANNSASAGVIVDNADLEVSKTVDQASPKEGDVLTYTVTVRNNGPSGATLLVISDTLPAPLTLLAADAGPGSYDSAAGTWTIGKLLAGRSVTLTLTAAVNPDTAGQTFTNTAAIARVDQSDAISQNNTAAAVARVSRADLALTKSVNNPTPNEGEVVSYTLTISNAGPDPATGIAISETLPPGLVPGSISASQGSYAAGSWTVGDLPAGESTSLILLAAPEPGTAGQTITNTASLADFDQTDPDLANNTASATIRVTNAELALTKTADRVLLNENQPLTYTLVLSNAGPDDATGVVVSDTLPAGLSLVAAGASAGSYAGGAWTVGDLPAGQSASLLLAATVNPGTAGQVMTNTAEISLSGQSDANPANNSASAAIRVTNAELELIKTVDASHPDEGDSLVYTVAITNHGPDGATGVVVSDTLPAGLSLVSANTAAGSYAAGSWTVGDLPAGGSASLLLAATVDLGTAGQPFTNTAEISLAGQSDANPANNSASAGLTVTAVDLAVTKQVDLGRTRTNDQLTYTVVVSNAGPDEATGVTISDLLPGGLSFVGAEASLGSYDAPTGAWQMAALPVGQPATLVITAAIRPGTAGETVTNVARVGAVDQGDLDETNNMASAAITVSRAAVSLSNTVSNPHPAEGDTLVYTVVISNAGPDEATGLAVSDPLPPVLSFISAGATLGSYDEMAGLWTVGSLPAGGSATLTITAAVRANTAGLLVVNTATVSDFDQTDPDTTDNTAEAVARVADADLKVTKIVNRARPREKDVVSYLIVVSNAGPDEANGVVVSDTLPFGLSYIGASASQGTYDSAAGTWTVGVLAAGQSASLALDTRVDPATAGLIITNTAEIASPGRGDSDPTNNRASVTIRVPNAELSLTKTVDKPRPLDNELVTYTITVTNNGPDEATGLTISDTVPAGLTFASHSANRGSYNPITGLWTVGSLPSGSSARLTLAAVVRSIAAGQTLTNTAEIDGVNQGDADPANNTASAVVTVPGSDLVLTKLVDQASPQEKDQVKFTVTIANAGPDNAAGVVIGDVMPPGLSLVQAESNRGSYEQKSGLWRVGDLPANSSTSLTLVAQVARGTGGRTITNTASVQAPLRGDPDRTNNSAAAAVTVQGADLVLTKALAGPAIAGQPFTYTLTVFNAGPSPATEVTVTDPLPDGLNFVSAGGGSLPCVQMPNDAIRCGPGTLDNQATLTVSLVVTAAATGPISNTASVAAGEPDPDPANNTAAATADVAAPVPEEGPPLYLPLLMR